MIYVTLESIRCDEETDEIGADEPYVVVIAVDPLNQVTVPVAGVPGIDRVRIPAPTTRTLLYGPFQDVDQGETHAAGFRPFWGLNGDERALPANPDDVIFLVCMMENDDGDAELFRKIVGFVMGGAIVSNIGGGRGTQIARAAEALDVAARIPTGLPNLDDRIGGLQELRFTSQEAALAETGNPARRTLVFAGDGGQYTLTFQARNRGQTAWRFCGRCRSMFWNGRSQPDARVTGSCPDGPGGHDPVGFTFFLPHDYAGPFGGDQGWRFCDRCFALFQVVGAGAQGACAAGPGGHAFTPRSFQFFLPHNPAGPGQDEWRICQHCHVLFWDHEPNKGVCAVDPTGHRAEGGSNYKLDFEP